MPKESIQMNRLFLQSLLPNEIHIVAIYFMSYMMIMPVTLRLSFPVLS